jgi:signal transduction histidine kinase
MHTTIPFPVVELSEDQNAGTVFRSVFGNAPIAVARCNQLGLVGEMNTAFERMMDHVSDTNSTLCLSELAPFQDREKIELLLRELFTQGHDRASIETMGAGRAQTRTKWTAWRQSGANGEPVHALLIAEPCKGAVLAEEEALQAQRWEAVGRLAGGVVHDFNNLLTGIMLHCDLLLSSLDGRDCRRRYADDIRSAIVQSTDLVRQLLVFARPRSTPAQPVCLNEIVATMRGLLTRLIGENIELDLSLDADLGQVTMDQAQAQQVVLNLVLNARDALPEGGHIRITTSNCNLQPLGGTPAQGQAPGFPCVLLVVGDNGRGMNAETRERLFQPFFTTKNNGKGTGLGLTTVHSIVTTNRGLIQFESAPGCGTRAMILLPRTCPSADYEPLHEHQPDSRSLLQTPLTDFKKESHL